MLTINPIRNNSNQNNSSLPSFGMNYARSFRNALRDNADRSTYDDASFQFAKEGINRLGALRKRNDGLVAERFQVGDVSDLTIRNKAGQIVTNINQKLVDWFIDRQTPMKKEELKATAKTRLEDLILYLHKGNKDCRENRELNDLLTNDKVPYFDKWQFYVNQSGMQKLLISAEYFESPEFLKTMEEGFKTEGKSKAEVLAYLKKANEPIYCGKGEKKLPTIREKINETIANFFSFVDDSASNFEDWLGSHPEFLHYSKNERAKMKELRKLIDEQLG